MSCKILFDTFLKYSTLMRLWRLRRFFILAFYCFFLVVFLPFERKHYTRYIIEIKKNYLYCYIYILLVIVSQKYIDIELINKNMSLITNMWMKELKIFLYLFQEFLINSILWKLDETSRTVICEHVQQIGNSSSIILIQIVE